MSVSKIVAAAASGFGSDPLDVDEVFSCHLYEGNGAQNLTVTNGIDLAGEGGMVWYRRRDGAENNSIEDTERGLDNVIYTDSANAQADPGAYGLQAFNSDGFTAGYDLSGGDYVSWTFRKAPKFFDVVTYSGTGSTSHTINHSLGVTPAVIIVKRTNASANWVYHQPSVHTPSQYLLLNNTSATQDDGAVNNFTNLTSTSFRIDSTWTSTNASGGTYVAYLFAHNNSDGGFGPDSDQDIIKCGSFTSDSSGIATVNLGFEPQWVLFKGTHAGSSWFIVDVMRGMVNGANDAWLAANLTNAEGTSNTVITPTPTGFVTDGTNIVDPSQTFIFMAIRRGPLAVPDDATKVFNVATYSSNSNSNLYNTGFDVDMAINTTTISNSNYVLSRLTNKYLDTNSIASDNTLPSSVFNSESNVINLNAGWWGTTNTVVSYSWRRAPGYFDVVCYAGSTTTPRTISHNLTVIPEMIWLKGRDAGGGQWYVYHKDTGNQAYGALNNNYYIYTASDGVVAQTIWNATNPTASVFSLGNASNGNSNGQNFIAYLFATAPGVSKVGSFTGSTSDVTVDCGFSSGAKFVMVKDASANGDWYVWDSVRGIVAGNEGYLELNTPDAENTGSDYIDPHSSGFIITSGFMQSGRTYIFYAIA